MSTPKNLFFSSVELTKISVADLKVGMYVSELDRPWEETNFLFQGFELKNEADIKAVQEQCRFVFIDISKQTIILPPKVSSTPYTKTWLENCKPLEKKSCFAEEISKASEVHKQLSTVVKSFMQEVSLGKSIDVALAKDVVASIVDSVIQSPDAMMWLTQLKKRDEYTSQHSMNVAVFSIALGRQLGLSIPELNDLGLCGMMHDMGKMLVPLEVLNKPGRLTDEEFKIMNRHPALGWKLLLSSSGMYGGAIDVAHNHHEKLDGTGYPRGLKAEQISPYTRIVTIVDMYDAITSDRVYKKGRTHLEGIKIMTDNGGTHLDFDLTVKFIECLGIYPPGNIVEMTNGEVAVVIETNPKHKLKPQVVFILDENKQRQEARLVDLAEMNLDKSGQPYRIKRMVNPEDYHIDLNAFYHEHM
jgi:HD-GYP domain-containing protein (c-di-GMP phosphodiesterase class II)